MIAQHLNLCAACRQQVLNEAEPAALHDDLHWAKGIWDQSAVDVNVPLQRLSALLPNYEILGEIGRGGMGIVYRARHLKMNRIVALKVLPALLAVVRPDAIARFRREAELAGRLKHTNIITVYDFDEIDGTLFYAMELIEGRTLAQVLRDINDTAGIDGVIGLSPSGSSSLDAKSGNRLRRRSRNRVRSGAEPTGEASDATPTRGHVTRLGSSARADRAYYRRAAEWVAEVAEALQFAHGHGVIHRDIKPSNLLIAPDGRMMISDFGLARAVGLETVTGDRTMLGTARYMSPEQVGDESNGTDRAKRVDVRTDIYALGATLYELLALRPMFASADDREVLDNVLNRDPDPPRRFVRHVPRELETICLKAIEKEQQDRYATAQAMADDLRRWLLDLPIHARRPSPVVRMTKFVRRRKLPVALTALCVFLAAGSGALVAANRSSHRKAEENQATLTVQRIKLLLNDAESTLDQGQFATALEAIRAGQRIDLQSGDLRRLEARALTWMDRNEEAFHVLTEQLAQEPDDWMAHYLMALLLADHNHESAVHPYSPQVVAIESLSADEQRERSVEHKQRVVELAPDSAEAFLLQATDEADPANAIVLLTEALQRTPMMAAALIRRAARYEQIGDRAAWLDDAEKVVAIRPGWAAAHLGVGRALQAVGRYSEAEKAYGRAIELEPEYAGYWHNRSLLKSSLGRFREALVDAGNAIRLDPKYAYAFAARAQAHAGLGQYESALADYHQAQALQPNDIELYLGRGKVYFDAGRLEEARAEMTLVVTLHPDDPRGYGNRAVAHILLKQYDQAIDDLTQSIRLNPADAKAHRNRGHARALMHQNALAVEDYSRAIDIDPTVPGDFSSRANLLIQMSEYHRAVDDLSKLIEMNPDGRGQILLRRGMVYELLDAPQLAKADYQAASALTGPVAEYAKLWRYLLSRSESDSTNPLALDSPSPADNSENGPRSWTARLHDFFAEAITPDELLHSVSNDDERAEAYYYIGRKSLLTGDRKTAESSFRQCVALNRNGVLEARFARALLTRLGVKTIAAKDEPDERR